MGAAKGVLRSVDVEAGPAASVLRPRSAKWRVPASRALNWAEVGTTAVAVLLATLLRSAEWGVRWWLWLAVGGGLMQCAAGGTYRERLGGGVTAQALGSRAGRISSYLWHALNPKPSGAQQHAGMLHSATYSRVQHANRSVLHMQGWAQSMPSPQLLCFPVHPVSLLSSCTKHGTPRHSRWTGLLRQPTPLHVC